MAEQTLARQASITLGAQGRLVLPAPFRKALDLSAGEHLLVRLEADHLVIEKSAAVESTGLSVLPFSAADRTWTSLAADVQVETIR